MNNKGITPVISYVLLVGIVVITTSAAYFWAYPHINRLGEGPKAINLVNQMESLDYAFRNVVHGEIGSQKSFSMHMPEGNIRLDEENDKIVFNFRQGAAIIGHIPRPDEINRPRYTWETQSDWENNIGKENISIKDGEVSLKSESDEFIVSTQEEWENGNFSYTELENESLALLSEEAIYHNDSIPNTIGQPNEWETFYNETRSVRFLDEITVGYRYRLLGTGEPFMRSARIRAYADGKHLHEDESHNEESWETWFDQINVSDKENIEIIFQYYSEGGAGHESEVQIDWANQTFMNISDSGTYNSKIFETDIEQQEPHISSLNWEGELPEETEILYRVRGREDEEDDWMESIWVNATETGETISGSEFIDGDGNRIRGYEWQFEVMLVNGDYPKVDEVEIEVATDSHTPGYLEMEPVTLTESQPNLKNLDYELDNENITINVTGSPGTDDEETVTQELDGEEEYNLTWDESHEEFQLGTKLAVENTKNAPTLNALTLEVEEPEEIEYIPMTCEKGKNRILEERTGIIGSKIGEYSQIYAGSTGAPGTSILTLCNPNVELEWRGNCIKGRGGPRTNVIMRKEGINYEGNPVISIDFC
ncbi:MAG: hypothetical protein ACOCTT_01420 [archaeon]